MKPETKVKRAADKKIISDLIRDNRVVELSDYRSLLEKEKNRKLTQVEESTLYYYRYSTKK